MGKKKSKEKYELERRQIELEEQLLDIQQRRLDLEQKRVELQLKKVRLATRKPKGLTHSKSAPPILIRDGSLQGRSDDESSFLTAPTVSTHHEYSDHSGEIRFPSQRFSGNESDGEEELCSPKAESKPRRFSDARRSSSAGDVSDTTAEVPNAEPGNLMQRSSSETCTQETSHVKAHDGKFQSSAKRAVQSMRNLVSTRPSPDESERSESLRDLLTDTHADAFSMLRDSCNQSTETYHSGSTKVTSNVSEQKKSNLNRGRSYPSLKEDRSSLHNCSRNLSTGDFQNGEFVYEWPDGRRYEGSWKDGKVSVCILYLQCVFASVSDVPHISLYPGSSYRTVPRPWSPYMA